MRIQILRNQEAINKRHDSIENDFVNLRDELADIRRKEEENSVDIDGLKVAMDWKFNCIKNIQFEQLRQEQYRRKSSFIVHGVTEEEQESLEEKTIRVLANEIGVRVDKEEIDIVHRTTV
eukprot:gene1770-16253_t